jgi:hypothetical protein
MEIESFDQVGGQLNYNVYRGRPFQRGYGLGGMFGKFFRWIVPIVKSHATPILEKSAKAVGEQVLASSADIARDLIAGKSSKENLQAHFNSAVNNLQERAEKSMSGGKKRKKMTPKFFVKRKKHSSNHYPDIFD